MNTGSREVETNLDLGRYGELRKSDLNKHRCDVFIDNNGGLRLSAVDFGRSEGGCVLFLHGGGGHLLQWHHQLRRFCTDFRVVAVDLRGHGLSDCPDSRYDMNEFVTDICWVIEKLEIPKPFYLVAHSYGGALAAEYAVKFGDRLSGLILMSTAGEIPLSWTLRLLLRLPSPLLRMVQRVVRNSVSTPPRVLKKMIPHLVAWRGWHLYERITVPTLVISGDMDMLTRPEEMRRMAELIPDAQLETIRFAGHLPQLERPGRVNRILERFLLPQVRRNWRGI